MKLIVRASLIYLCLIVNHSIHAQNEIPDGKELEILHDLYTKLDGENWSNNAGWPDLENWPSEATSADYNQWHGVVVRNEDIISISLPANNLSGELPSTLASLTALKYLNLADNEISGNLPSDIGNLSQLMFLLVGDNQLDGLLPSGLGDLTQLREMRLHNNNLWGSIPPSLGQLNQLAKLLLHGNHLTGSIPSSLGDMTSIVVLALNHNSLTGEVPSSIVSLPALKNLILNHNSLSGFPNFINHPNRDILAINIRDNQIAFADISQNMIDNISPYSAFDYVNQSSFGEKEQEVALLENQTISISTYDSTSSNTYTWEKKGNGRIWNDVTGLNEHPTGERFIIHKVSTNDAGIYRYKITNSILGASKTSNEIHISVQTKKQDFLDRWAFQYRYDGRQRMTKKRVPGSGWVYMVYDHRDRLVLTQDSVQRKDWQWTFTKYDVLNRPIMTGIYQMGSNISQKDIQSYLNIFYQNPSFPDRKPYETYIGDKANSLKGYTNNSFPNDSTRISLLSVSYYDQYNFKDDLPAFGNTYTYDSLQLECKTTNDNYCFPSTAFEIVKGQITGSQTRILGTDQWLSSITYYDDRYRIIQTHGENQTTGVDITSSLYDFMGNVLLTKTIHNTTSESHTIFQEFTYDHTSRLLSVTHQLDHQQPVVLAENNYNELGELIEKNIHVDGDKPAQSIDYRYNIRGWLSSINNASLTDDKTTNDDTDDLFGMKLVYNEIDLDLNNTPSWNGNISAMAWSNPTETDEISSSAYTYQYDPLNRLTSAQHHTNHLGWTSENGFSVSDLAYDLNGNILKLRRNNEAGSGLDVLEYTYASDSKNSNQLLEVTDSGDIEAGFVDGNRSGLDYTYDGNGNMITDLNKNITHITYNHLNLPERVDKVDGHHIIYRYDAAGIKLAQEVYAPGGVLQKKTEYIGEYVYEDGQLQFIQHAEGRIVSVIPGDSPGVSTYDYQYHLKDHLGNVRMTFSTTPENYTMVETFETGGGNGFQDLHIETKTQMNTTQPYGSSNKVELLTSGQTGAMIFIGLNKGDTIDLTVNANFVTYPSANNFLSTVYNTLFNTFDTNFGSGQEGGVSSTSTVFDDALSSSAMSQKSNENAPRAFLNYIIFDKEMSYVTAGFQQISSAAKSTGPSTSETISINDIIADREGYILAYLSNENQEAFTVHFDDFTVYHAKTNVVSTQDYYPFGLSFNTYQRTASTPQKYLFNSNELDDEIGLYSYGSRNYDAAIGRWIQIDPASDLMHEWSLYNYNYNNPLNYIDPDGSIPWPIRKFFFWSGFRKSRPDGVFGERRSYYKPGQTHAGIDLNFSGGGNTDRGAPVVSTHGGKVVEVVKYSDEGNNNSGGTWVKIQGPDGQIRTVYMHLDEVFVEEGQTVSEGQKIGTLGGSGFGKRDHHTAHLHYEIRVKNSDGIFTQINPWNGDQPIDAQVLVNSGGSPSEIISTLEQENKSLAGTIQSQENRIARREKKGKSTAALERRVTRNKKRQEQNTGIINALSSLE